jgi:hypothetical protein
MQMAEGFCWSRSGLGHHFHPPPGSGHGSVGNDVGGPRRNHFRGTGEWGSGRGAGRCRADLRHRLAESAAAPDTGHGVEGGAVGAAVGSLDAVEFRAVGVAQLSVLAGRSTPFTYISNFVRGLYCS